MSTDHTAPIRDMYRAYNPANIDPEVAALDQELGKFVQFRPRDVIEDQLLKLYEVAEQVRLPLNTKVIAGRRTYRNNLPKEKRTAAHDAEEKIDNLYTVYRNELRRLDEREMRFNAADDDTYYTVEQLDARRLRRKEQNREAAARKRLRNAEELVEKARRARTVQDLNEKKE
jgi:hypothetical protein